MTWPVLYPEPPPVGIQRLDAWAKERSL
jgi:hypothetical protein